MQLIPYVHLDTGVTVYVESDPQDAAFRQSGQSFEARTAPFEEDKPSLLTALIEVKRRIIDQANTKAALVQTKIDELSKDMP